jgi:hypothetical protein
LLPPIPESSDVPLYASYAREQEYCARAKRPFYRYHAEVIEQIIEDARTTRSALATFLATGAGLAASPDKTEFSTLICLLPLANAPVPRAPGAELRDVEYPPLALELLRLPTLWMSKQPADRPVTARAIARYNTSYTAAYRWGMAVVDALLFVLILLLIWRGTPAATWGDGLQRITAYLLATLALWPVLYDRLDLVLALLMALSLYLLITRLHYAWSFAVLALAVNFKLVPVVLAPVWIVGTLPTSVSFSLSDRHFLKLVGLRCSLLIVLIIAWFLPFYLASGSDTLRFFSYHKQRGLEIGSLYSSALLALRPLGQPVEIYHAHQCFNVRSAASPLLVTLSPLVVGGLLLAVSALLLARFRQLGRNSSLIAQSGNGKPAEGPGTLAQLYPADIAGYSLLFLLIFIAANKVFSPQYLLWLVPFVVLLPYGRKGQRIFLGCFVVTCVMTTLLFPFWFFSDVAVRLSATAYTYPTPRGLLLLGVRNLLVVSLTVALAAFLWRRSRALS